jgi:hypothetical protein
MPLNLGLGAENGALLYASYVTRSMKRKWSTIGIDSVLIIASRNGADLADWMMCNAFARNAVHRSQLIVTLRNSVVDLLVPELSVGVTPREMALGVHPLACPLLCRHVPGSP